MSAELTYDPATHKGLTYLSETPLFKANQSSPVEYLERCLKAITERENRVQAWVVLNEEGARKQAEASAKRWQEGNTLSPIDGMPIGIKDLLETKDMPTQMGCEAFNGNFPKRDNAAVRALREAGAVILGKTVTAELGSLTPGPTTNPFDSGRTPGGSSSGSAAAVAAGMVPATIGSQVGGSIIRPASFCGNWALKPSQGAINRGERQSTSMSTHGVHANSPEDMWAVAIEIAKRAGGDPGHFPLQGPDSAPDPQKPQTIAVLESEGWSEASEEARTQFENIVQQVEKAGVRVLRHQAVSELESFETMTIGLYSLTMLITAWENQWALRNLIEQVPDGVSRRTKALVDDAQGLGVEGYMELLQRRESVRAAFKDLKSTADAFLMLSAPGPAPALRQDVPGQPLSPMPTGNPVFNVLSSATGAPAVTVPKLSAEGLPLGIQLIGQRGTDSIMIAFARWLGDIDVPSDR